jgi:opacity protein-like surface antigen
VDSIPIKSSFDYGVLFDYAIWPGFDAEFMWNRQPTELHAFDASTGSSTKIGPANLDMYQFGAAWELRGEEAKLKPFIALGLGFTHFNTNGALTDFGNRFAYSVGGGVKYEASAHVGLRLDVRFSPTRTTQSDVTYVSEFGEFTERVNNHANQGQANVGVIFRF